MSRFLLGLAAGALVGVVAVAVAARRVEAGGQTSLRQLIDGALSAGRQAATAHEHEQWQLIDSQHSTSTALSAAAR